jgi:hypothetical protein
MVCHENLNSSTALRFRVSEVLAKCTRKTAHAGGEYDLERLEFISARMNSGGVFRILRLRISRVDFFEGIRCPPGEGRHWRRPEQTEQNGVAAVTLI